MEEVDLSKAFDEVLKSRHPPTGAALEDPTEAANPISPKSILPPEVQAWLDGLNPFCLRAVRHDLRTLGPDLFVKHWVSLRETLQKLERDLGPSDNWT